MQESQKEGVVYDPFNPDENILEKIVNLGIQKVGEKHREFLTTFAKTYGLDFCPTYSVVGSIISQEVIKIAESTYIYIETKLNLEWIGSCSTVSKVTVVLWNFQLRRKKLCVQRWQNDWIYKLIR